MLGSVGEQSGGYVELVLKNEQNGVHELKFS